MSTTNRMLQKMIAIAHSKPQLPLFTETHLPTFKQLPAKIKLVEND